MTDQTYSMWLDRARIQSKSLFVLAERCNNYEAVQRIASLIKLVNYPEITLRAKSKDNFFHKGSDLCGDGFRINYFQTDAIAVHFNDGVIAHIDFSSVMDLPLDVLSSQIQAAYDREKANIEELLGILTLDPEMTTCGKNDKTKLLEAFFSDNIGKDMFEHVINSTMQVIHKMCDPAANNPDK